jgi:uncharacterized membrane protein YkoI
MKRSVLIALLSTLAVGTAACGAASAITATDNEANESAVSEANEGPEAAEAGEAGEASEAVAPGVARLSLADARAIALKIRPGKIVEGELEREAGGSGVRYSFVIKSGGKDYEVGVDAANGKILENQAEGANPD